MYIHILYTMICMHVLQILYSGSGYLYLTRHLCQVIRSSDICVSERTPLNTLILKPYKPIWNELTGEVYTCTTYTWQ